MREEEGLFSRVSTTLLKLLASDRSELGILDMVTPK